MRPESRQFIHMGINYVITPSLEIDRIASLRFQESLIRAGIEFTTSSVEGSQIKVLRKAPFPLEIMVAGKLTQPQPFAQILVIASRPDRSLDAFSQEVESTLQAFEETWPTDNRQIVTCDVTLRCLYPSTSEHAFKEIWEARLCQQGESLKKFGRPVVGGGLRFVMSPQKGDSMPTKVEVKIESFLGDTKKLFVETQFTWPVPTSPGTPFRPTDRLAEVDQFITSKVHAFMTEAE